MNTLQRMLENPARDFIRGYAALSAAAASDAPGSAFAVGPSDHHRRRPGAAGKPGKVVGAGRDETLTVLARNRAAEEGTRHGLSDQRIGHRLQRARRGDGHHRVVTPWQAGGVLAWPGHARPGRHILGRGDLNLGPARTWIATLRPRPGLPLSRGRASPGYVLARTAAGSGPPGPPSGRPGRSPPGPDHAARPERTATGSRRRLSRYRGIRPGLP